MKIYEKLSWQILRSSHYKYLVVTLPIPQMNLEKYEHPCEANGLNPSERFYHKYTGSSIHVCKGFQVMLFSDYTLPLLMHALLYPRTWN